VIVRQDGDNVVLIRQADHAYLSGQLAAAWGTPPWEVPEPYPSVVLGARLHDEAWLYWDEAPGQRDDGLPRSFYEVDRVVTTGLYTHGVEAVCALDLYAGLLVSLHYTGFFHGHWDWMPLSSVENFAEPESTALRLFVTDELRRQQELRTKLRLDLDDELRLAANYKWLQLWDRISLDVCRRDPAQWAERYPLTPTGSGTGSEGVLLQISMPEPGRCVLDPYPLRRAPFLARVPAVRLPPSALLDRQTFINAWRTADAVVYSRFEPPSL
jgi:hypothetical protein